MGAFEALLELLDVDPLLPAEAPLAVRSTPLGWKVFTRAEVVPALIFILGGVGRDPMHFALHSGGKSGGNPASVPRNLGVANPARRTVDVTGVHDVREGGRGRGKLQFGCSRQNGV